MVEITAPPYENEETEALWEKISFLKDLQGVRRKAETQTQVS